MLEALLVYGLVAVVIVICILAANREQIMVSFQKKLVDTPWDYAVSQSIRYNIKHEQAEDWEEKFAGVVGQPYQRKNFSYDDFLGLTQPPETKALPEPRPQVELDFGISDMVRMAEQQIQREKDLRRNNSTKRYSTTQAQVAQPRVGNEQWYADEEIIDVPATPTLKNTMNSQI